MTNLDRSDAPAGDVGVDALVLGIGKGPDGRPVLQPGLADLDSGFPGGLLAALIRLGATGKAEEVWRLASFGALRAPSVLAVGLGAPDAAGRYSGDALRRAAGAAARALAGVGSAATTLSAADPDALRPVAEGFALGAYSFTRYHTAAGSSTRKPPVGAVTLLGGGADSDRELSRAGVLGEVVALARDLVNTPAADLHPADLAERARQEAAAAGVDVEVMDERALADGGYGGLLGVGQGAADPPRLVRIAHRGDAGAPTVALVGKGITFDTGGLALKPLASMDTMKCDMSGAAAVLASVVAAARLGLRVNVTGWLACAENMPSGTAIRPSDVLHIYGGRTVEVLNTDAEGRLVMADAIVRAAEEQPDSLIDLATLTGAQVVALGSRTFAVMGNDGALRAAVLGAAEDAGEAAWPMPLPEDLRASLDSEVADIANIGDRNGGMLVAGLFLREFVPDGLPWAHLDIAGPAFNSGDAFGYTPKGGTGSGVRTVVRYLERLSDR